MRERYPRVCSRERAGDVDGMVALYEPQAVLDAGEGYLIQGREAIRAFYASMAATGRKFEFGDQCEAVVSGDLGLTSTRFANGSVTAEIARRQSDGTWLRAIDRFSVA